MSGRNLVWLLLLCVTPVLAADPMRPPNLESPAQEIVHEPLRLSLILSDAGRKRAVVNGKVLSVSERIGNARLEAINDDHVVMTRAGQRFVLRLAIPAIRQESDSDE